MNEVVSRGLIPAYEMLHVGVASGARAVLGRNRPDPISEGIAACWKASPTQPFVPIVLGMWDVVREWVHESPDADRVRATFGPYGLLQGRPAEELITACRRVLLILEMWGSNAFVVEHTLSEQREKYYRIVPDAQLARTLWDSCKLRPQAADFADRVAERVYHIRRNPSQEKAASKSWHEHRIQG